jgi:cyclopropane-fatty-acyl-phospholipid synthase
VTGGKTAVEKNMTRPPIRLADSTERLTPIADPPLRPHDGGGMIWTTSDTRIPPGAAADLLWPALSAPFHGDLPVRLRAWDGSEIGPPDRPTLVVADRQALRRILWQPDELGLARGYVTGELDVDGDLTECVRLVWQAARSHGLTGGKLSLGSRIAAMRAAVRLGAVGPPPAPPASEARFSDPPRSANRRQQVSAYPDEVPSEFYQLILGPQMAYSAAHWTPGCQSLAQAQAARLDAICTALRLEPGMRLLDVGCGWGALAIHAARTYGAQVTAVTPSSEQAAFVEQRAARLGLGSLVTVQMQQVRDIAGPPHDAVASIEMSGRAASTDYRAFCDLLRGQVGGGGLLLIQQMSRESRARGGAFVERYIMPDLQIRPAGETIGMLERAGFKISDVQAMRRDCARTIRAWHLNLERRWEDAVAILGMESARAWRLYLASGALAFEQGQAGVHQILAAPARAGAHRAIPAATSRRPIGAPVAGPRPASALLTGAARRQHAVYHGCHAGTPAA